MAASARCLGCGGRIDMDNGCAPDGVIARGDRFMHEGCVIDSAAMSIRPRPGVPAYHIPKGR